MIFLVDILNFLICMMMMNFYLCLQNKFTLLLNFVSSLQIYGPGTNCVTMWPVSGWGQPRPGDRLQYFRILNIYGGPLLQANLGTASDSGRDDKMTMESEH